MATSTAISARRAYRKFVVIAVLATLIPLLSLLAGGTYLYNQAMNNQVKFLQDEVNNLARVLSAFGDEEELRQALQSLDSARGLGQTGEVLVAGHDDGELQFLVAQKFEQRLQELTVARNAKLAEPMQRALSGETGWMTGLDYDGEEVLAAFAPVQGTSLGVVAKIDEAEFNAPYWGAALFIAVLALPLMAAASLWVVRTGSAVSAELRRKQISLEVLLSNVPGVVYRTNYEPPRALVFVSDGVEEFLGLRPAEVLQRRMNFWSRIDDGERVQKELEAQLSQGKSYDLTYRLRLANGRQRWVRDQGRRVQSDSGDYIEGFMADVDDTMRALERVGVSEQRYRALFDNANDGIFLMEGMAFTECNPRTGDLFGTAPENLVGKSPVDFSPDYQPDGTPSADRAAELIQRMETEQAIRFEWRHRRLNGQEFDAEVSLSKLVIDQRTLLLAVVRDITEQKSLARESAARHAILQSVFDNTTDAVFVKDDAGRYLYVNKAVSDLTGIERDAFVGCADRDIWPIASAWQAIEQQDQAVLDAGRTETIEEANPNDLSRSLLTTKGVVRDAQGERIGLFGISRDITDLKATHRRLGFLSQALDQAEDIVFVTDSNGYLEYVNGAFERVTGYTQTEALGRHAKLLKSDQHNAEFYQKLWSTLRSGNSFSSIFINRRKNGELFHNHQTITPVLSNSGETRHYLAVGKDLSERLNLEEKLYRASYFDPLTKGPNRLMLREELQAAIDHRDSGQTVAFMVIDLHRFQRINDTFGNSAGDRVLRKSMERIQHQVGDSAVVGRVGSDEFGVILRQVESPYELTRLAEKIQHAFSHAFNIEGRPVFTRVNVGISVAPDDGENAEDLLFSADSAMIEAKQAKPGSHRFFSQELRNRASRRLMIEDGLRGAVEKHQFELHYQPKVLASTGETVGAEALLRWRHPEMGWVSPGEFIPVAEETGLIVEIGYWVVGEACRMAAQLQKAGNSIPIAINLSPKQFDDPQLGDEIRRALESEGLASDQLECEITESTFVSNAEALNTNLGVLREIGVTLAIDDFGTGYSSLSHLKRLPVSVLKIDRSFIRDIAVSEDDQALVRSMVAIADSLSLTTVVEWVENEQQLSTIRRLGCDVVQGFYFSRGLPELEFQKWIRAGAPA
ncbi:MAG: EAL domain-containing protein [Pseudomonadota bacterium]|nr:EAL domain-containing protein [Pseudomonadota bacterium]